MTKSQEKDQEKTPAVEDITSLSGPEFPPFSGVKPKHLVIMLHGLGANGNDLFSLAPYFAEEIQDVHFFSPDAPFACDMAPVGKQWFSLKVREESAILAGIEKAASIVNKFIDKQLKKYSLDEQDLILLGFSQGAMLAMHVALRRPKPIAGVLSYSGAVVGAKRLKSEIKSRPPICLIHGEDDQVVPFFAFQEAMVALQDAGVIVHGYSREGLGHGIDPAGIKVGIDFIKKSFDEVIV